MEITVKIEAAELAAAITRLADALAARTSAQSTPAEAPAIVPTAIQAVLLNKSESADRPHFILFANKQSCCLQKRIKRCFKIFTRKTKISFTAHSIITNNRNACIKRNNIQNVTN